MANEIRPSLLGFMLLGSFCLQELGNAGETRNRSFYFNCSQYTFYKKPNGTNWQDSKSNCEKSDSKLVSMENLRTELSFLDNQTQKSDTTEYLIGLRKVNGNFTWISGTSILRETAKSAHPWHRDQPSGTGKCVKIWRKEGESYLFDDVKCNGTYDGYICEKSVECKNKNAPKSQKTTTPSAKQATSLITGLSTKQATSITITEKMLSTYSHEQSAEAVTKHPSIRKSTTAKTKPQPTGGESTKHPSIRKSTTTTTKQQSTGANHQDITNKSPDENSTKRSPSLIVIILTVLAFIILTITIIFCALFLRRRRSPPTKTALISKEQSNDNGSTLQRSTELTVHFSMTQPYEEPIAFRKVNETKEECTYAVVDETKRRSKRDQRSPSSSHEEREEIKTLPNDGQSTEKSVSVKNTERIYEKNDQKNQKGHVYAVVHIKESQATVLREESPGANCAANSSTEGDNAAIPWSLKQETEMDSSEAADKKNPNKTVECGDNLYAVADKATVNESKQEHTYAVVNKTKRKSNCDISCNDEEGGKIQARPNDEQSTENSIFLKNTERIYEHNDQKNQKDNVYAVAHIKERKATVLREKSPGATCTTNSSTVCENDASPSSLKQENELDSSEAADKNNPKSTIECQENLYAVVDKANKKRKTPQKPAPYGTSGLVYADMTHLPDNEGGKINTAYSPTVYADINHSKREGVKSRLPTI